MTDDQSRLVPRASAVGSIDRDALIRVIADQEGTLCGEYADESREGLADEVLALVRPVVGVVLSREEAATAAACVRAASRVAYMRDDLAALASRLEASS